MCECVDLSATVGCVMALYGGGIMKSVCCVQGVKVVCLFVVCVSYIQLVQHNPRTSNKQRLYSFYVSNAQYLILSSTHNPHSPDTLPKVAG